MYYNLSFAFSNLSAETQEENIGINTIGELAACPDSALEYKYGISGIRLKECANGLDRTNVTRQDFEYPIKSVGNGITFLADLTEPDEVFPMGRVSVSVKYGR